MKGLLLIILLASALFLAGCTVDCAGQKKDCDGKCNGAYVSCAAQCRNEGSCLVSCQGPMSKCYYNCNKSC